MNRPIAIGLAPNLETDDTLYALKLLLTPQHWQRGPALKEVSRWFEARFNTPHVFTFNSGRSAEFALLQALGIGDDDEVLIQAFTCVAVPNSILWTRGRPVYVDIDKTLNIDATDAEKKITKKTRAIIVQHTFGIPAQMDKIIALARKHKLILIEDCAHSLGATYKGQKVGTFGDAAFFSFGRDKVVSSVFGGVAMVKDSAVANKLAKNYQTLSQPSFLWIVQQLLHPILFALILPLYASGLGKLLLVIAQKLHLLSFPVYREEKNGIKPSVFPALLPNALAALAYHQLKKLERFNHIRHEHAAYYREHIRSTKFPDVAGSIYLRFPIRSDNAAQLLAEGRKRGIILGNWYDECVAPAGVDKKAVCFDGSTVPHALQAAAHVVNLPTYPTLTGQQRDSVVKMINTYAH